MPGDPKLRELPDLAPGKQVHQVRANHARERDEQGAPLGHRIGHADEARQHARHLDDGDLVGAPKGILAPQAHDEVQRLVGHLRKRVRRVQPHRNQQGPDLALEIRLDPAALRRRALAVRDDPDAPFAKGRQQLVVVDHVLVRHQPARARSQRLERLPRVQAPVRARLAGAEVRLGPHFKELVEVGRDNAQVAQPLQQGHRGTAGPVKHPFVEGEDAVVAVQQCDGRRADRRVRDGLAQAGVGLGVGGYRHQSERAASGRPIVAYPEAPSPSGRPCYWVP
jgi:hypothetical protein